MKKNPRKKTTSSKKPAKKPVQRAKKRRVPLRKKSLKTAVVPKIQAAHEPPSSWHLPSSYGQDALVLMVRDPWWVFAYWEVTPETHRRAHAGTTVLRMYNVTDVEFLKFHNFFDIEINGANNWYVDVGLPNTEWVAEIGRRDSDGRFYPMLRSNRVRTPRYGVSDVIDEEWMLPDEIYWKLIGRLAGVAGESSLSTKEILERYLKGSASSERASSRSAKSQLIRA